MNIKKLSTPIIQTIYFLVSILVFSTNVAHSRTLIFQSGSESESSNKSVNTVEQAPTKSIPSAEMTQNTNLQPTNLNTSMSANTELFFMIEQLQQEVNSLRGLVEEQGYELRMLKQSGKDRYLDLDTRILDITKRLSTSVKANNSVNQHNMIQDDEATKPVKVKQEVIEGSASPAQVREPTKSENDAYQKAYTLIKDKNFDDSIIALFNYTEKYPESPLLPNVYYWLGEVYLATSKYEQAKTSFSFVVTAYPASQKTPDALYKLAVTLDRLGDESSAKDYISDVQNRFPNSTAAKLAAGYKF